MIIPELALNVGSTHSGSRAFWIARATRPSKTAIKFWSVRLSPPDYQCAAQVTGLAEFDFRYDAHCASLILRSQLKRCAVVRQDASPISEAETFDFRLRGSCAGDAGGVEAFVCERHQICRYALGYP